MSFSEIIIIVGQFFLSLSLLIVLHELGHFVPAKLFKTKVEKFFLFFDVKFSLVEKKIGETVYGIGWLPLGGYVKISGMIDESMDKEQLAKPPQPWEFRSKPAWQRLIIMLGGVFVNIVLAWIIYVGMAFVWGDKDLASSEFKDAVEVSSFLEQTLGLQTGDEFVSLDNEPVTSFNQLRSNLLLADQVTIKRNGELKQIQIPEDFLSQLIDDEPESLIRLRYPFVITKIPKDSHNANIGLEEGDIIAAVNGNDTRYTADVLPYLEEGKTTTLNVTIDRKGETLQKELKLENGKLALVHGGVSITDLGRLGFYNLTTQEYNLVESFSAGTKRFKEQFANFGKQLKKLVNPKTGAYKGLGSFISIAKIFPTSWDWQAFWNITAFLSIMLGVLNLLPIPALDGGHAMFLVYELVARRKPSDKFLEYAQMVGFVLLITLFVYAFGNDIYRHFIK